MPIVAQELIPLTITDDHQIIINAFTKCNCLNKSELIVETGSNDSGLLSALESLTSGGIITCEGDKCCVNPSSFNSFVNKLNKLK